MFTKVHQFEKKIIPKVFLVKHCGIIYEAKTSQLETASSEGLILGMVSIMRNGDEIFKSGFVVRVDEDEEKYLHKIIKVIPPHVNLELNPVGIFKCLQKAFNHYKPLAIEMGKLYKKAIKRR